MFPRATDAVTWWGRCVLATLLLLLARPGTARAEEAFVLDNGTVLRGSVVREEAGSIVVGLSGPGTQGQVTVARSRIVQRFVSVDPRGPVTARGEDGLALARPARAPISVAPPPPAAGALLLPAEEPALAEEALFSRMARRATMALPRLPGARAFLVALGVLVLLCLVALGGKSADVTGLTLGKSTLLALLLGAILAVFVLWGRTILRADLAPIVLPLAVISWIGVAAASLRCGFGKAFSLLAFVLLSGALVTFATGVVLVSV